jgi:hypothetical protein
MSDSIWVLFPRVMRRGARKCLGPYRPRSAWAKETLLFKMTRRRP